MERGIEAQGCGQREAACEPRPVRSGLPRRGSSGCPVVHRPPGALLTFSLEGTLVGSHHRCGSISSYIPRMRDLHGRMMSYRSALQSPPLRDLHRPACAPRVEHTATIVLSAPPDQIVIFLPWRRSSIRRASSFAAGGFDAETIRWASARSASVNDFSIV